MSFQSETPLGTEIKNATIDTPTDNDNFVFERNETASPFKLTYLALKNLLALTFSRYKYSQTSCINGESTISTTNTKSVSFLVLSNSFIVGDLIEIRARGIKTGTNGNFTIRLYVNTTDTISGATLLGTYSTTIASNTFEQISRLIAIKSETVSQTMSVSVSTQTDYAQSIQSSININHSINNYYIIALQCANASDIALSSFFTICKY